MLLGVALVLGACGADDPYSAAPPPLDDRGAIDAAMRSIAPEDRPLLSGYLARQREGARGMIPPQAQAETIAGAINDQRRTDADHAEVVARKRAAAELLERGLGGASAADVANMMP